jgi:hypothetical protein
MTAYFENENILKLVMNSFAYRKVKLILSRLTNQTLYQCILKGLTFADMLINMKKSKTLDRDKTIKHMVLLPNGELATITRNNIIIRETKNLKCIRIIEEEQINHIALICDNIIATSHSLYIKLWDFQNDYNCIKTITFQDITSFGLFLPLHNGMIICNANKGDGYDFNCVLIVDINNIHPIMTIKHPYLWDLVAIPNGRLALATCEFISILDTTNDFKNIKVFSDGAYSLLFMSKQNYIVSGNYKAIYVWDISSDYQLIKILSAHDREIMCLLLISNRYFASGSWDDIKLWDIDNYSCLNTLQGKQKAICSLMLLDKCRLISSSKDKMLLWNYKN